MRLAVISLILLCTVTLIVIGQRSDKLFDTAMETKGGEGMEFYVSPKGDDRWSGMVSAPDTHGKDGPFRSIERAKAAVRELHASGAPTVPVTIYIRGGTYFLSETLEFTSEDSGTDSAPITYAAYPDEQPILSGGRSVTGWKKGEGPLWTAEIPEVARGELYFHQLFVNDRRAVRARTPNEGYWMTKGPFPWIAPENVRDDPQSKQGFSFRPGDLQVWDDMGDANIVLFHSYTVGRHWIESIDTEHHTVRFVGPSRNWAGRWEKEQRYYVENVYEALDTPGEWYLDRATGMLYYWPLDGEEMNEASVIAPVLNTLIRFQGRAEEAYRVEHLNFQGLSFRHADWRIPEKGKDNATDRQAVLGHGEPSIGSAIEAVGARYISFEDIEIAHVGEYAISLGWGCQYNTIASSRIHDTGAGGIRIGEVNAPGSRLFLAEHNSVDNNHIYDGGHVFPAGVGVWIGHASFNRIAHNQIHDFTYSGVSVGWTWQYRESTSHDNLVEFNHIYNIGKRMLNDLGGIYTLGNSPGTILRNNLIHDVYAYGSHIGVGIYLDQATSDVLVENNIVYNVFSAGFFQNWGKENTIQNNVFAFSEQAGLGGNRREEHVSFRFRRNIVLMNGGEAVSSKYDRGQWEMEHNLYWNVSGTSPKFAGDSFEAWQATGRDVHSLIADPLFVNAQAYDFRLQPGSPAEKIGFQPIDLSAIGPYATAAASDQMNVLPDKP